MFDPKNEKLTSFFKFLGIAALMVMVVVASNYARSQEITHDAVMEDAVPHTIEDPIVAMQDELTKRDINFVWSSQSTSSMPNYPYAGRLATRVYIINSDTSPLEICDIADKHGVTVHYVENTSTNEAIICGAQSAFTIEPVVNGVRADAPQLEWMK